MSESDGSPDVEIDLREAPAFHAPARTEAGGATQIRPPDVKGPPRIVLPDAPLRKPPFDMPPLPAHEPVSVGPDVIEEPPVEGPALQKKVRRGLPVAAILIGLGALTSLGFGALSLVNQKKRPGGLVFLAVAWIVALAVIVFVLRRKVKLRYLIAAILAAALAAVSVPVVQLRCFERLAPSANLQGCDFANVDLKGRILSGANLEKATLTGAILTGTNFDNANLQGATLSRAQATSASFEGAQLEGATLDDATLDSASFANAKLQGASLVGASLLNVNFAGAVLSGAKLDGATLESAELGRVDLSNARLDRAGMRAAMLQGANLSGASLRDTTLNQAALGNANLSGATLDGANLRDANLNGTNLANASLRGTDLTNAVLSGAIFTGVTLQNAKMDGVTLIGATGLDDRVLAQGLGTTADALSGYVSAHGIRLESRSTILADLGGACRGTRVPGAAARSGSFHPLVVLDASGRSFDWSSQAESLGWEPMASRFAQYVACVQQNETVVQRCLYTEIGGFGRQGSITRYRQSARLRVIGAQGGTTLLDRSFQGSMPDACPAVTRFQTNGRISGSEIDFSTVRPALTSVVGTIPR